jgi:hypothetical protein
MVRQHMNLQCASVRECHPRCWPHYLLARGGAAREAGCENALSPANPGGCMRRTTPVIAVFLAAALTLIEPLGAHPTPWAKLHRPLHLSRLAPGTACPVSRIDRRIAWKRVNIFGGSGIGRGPGLPRPRRIRRAAVCDARRSVRRSLGRRKSLLVRAAKLSGAGADSRSSTGRPAVAQVQRSQAPAARAAHRAL